MLWHKYDVLHVVQAGTYQVRFIIPGSNNPPTVIVTVHVVDCKQGETTAATGDACQTCDRGYYSLDPRRATCDNCVPNADCLGGANIVPSPGYWHSAPHSIQMHM